MHSSIFTQKITPYKTMSEYYIPILSDLSQESKGMYVRVSCDEIRDAVVESSYNHVMNCLHYSSGFS